MGTPHSLHHMVLVIVASLSLALAPGATRSIERPRISAGEIVSQAQNPEPHEPPVMAPVVDPFRPPPQPWLPGNRGIEYGPTAAMTVRASASGVVTFAGPVAGNLFVTVAHDSSLRTTVGFLSEISVSAGDLVVQGQPLGIAGDRLHFSARRDGAYIDPTLLFQRFETRVRLVR